MRGIVGFGLLVGLTLAVSRPLGGQPLPRPTAGPVAPQPASPLLRSVPLALADALSVDEQTGRAFVAGGGVLKPGYVAMLDARTGAVRRTVTVGLEPVAVALDPFTNRVFVTNHSSGAVSVLDARNGALVRTVALGAFPFGMAVDVATGRLFVLVAQRVSGLDATADAVDVLDARSGGVLRRVRLGGVLTALVADAAMGRLFVSEPTVGAVQGNNVLVLDARNGTLLHTIPVGDNPGPLAIDAQLAYVFVLAGGGATVLDARSGGAVRSISTGGAALALAVAPHAGRVFVALSEGGSAGALAVLDARAGTLLRTVGFDRPVAATPVVDEQSHRVYVPLISVLDRRNAPINPGVLRVLDSRTGIPIQTITLPHTISTSAGVVVDARMHRVFVLTDGFVNVYDATQL